MTKMKRSIVKKNDVDDEKWCLRNVIGSSKKKVKRRAPAISATESSRYYNLLLCHTHTLTQNRTKLLDSFNFLVFRKIFLLFGIWKWILSRSNCMKHSLTSFIGKIYKEHTHTHGEELWTFFFSLVSGDDVWRGEVVKYVMWCSTPIAIIHTAIKNKKEKNADTHTAHKRNDDKIGGKYFSS